MGDGVLDGLADGDAQAAGRMRVFRQDFAAIIGLVAGAGMHRGAPGVHEHAAVGLLAIAHPHHINVAFEPKEFAGQRQRRSPLAGAGLGRQTLGAGDLVEVSLGHRGVDLLAARRAGAFVLIVNVGGGLQGLLETHRPHQRGRTPQRVDVAHRFGHLDITLGAHLLLDQVLWEDGQQGLRRDGLAGPRVQRRRQRLGEIRQQVVPRLRNIGLCQVKSRLHSLFSGLLYLRERVNSFLASFLAAPGPGQTGLRRLATLPL